MTLIRRLAEQQKQKIVEGGVLLPDSVTQELLAIFQQSQHVDAAQVREQIVKDIDRATTRRKHARKP